MVACTQESPNQVEAERRILFSALTYTLMQRLRELALATTELAKATVAIIRVRLFKIGAAVVRNTRRIRILLGSRHPLRDLSSPPTRWHLHSSHRVASRQGAAPTTERGT